MAQTFQKILKNISLFSAFIFVVFLWPTTGALCKSAPQKKQVLQKKQDTSFISRQWVVKLKQNSFTNRRPFQFATPVIDGGKLFVGVQRGFFYCIDVEHARKDWIFKAQGAIYASARVDGENVYFADTKGAIYALNKKTGKLVWISKIDGEVVSAPLIQDGKIYFVTLAKELAALDISNGNLLWQTRQRVKDSSFTIMGAADPVFYNGMILVGYSDGTLVAHSVVDGSARWVKQLGDRTQAFHDVDATILIVGKLAYLSSADGKFYALNPENGQTVWEVPVGSVNSAALAGNNLYLAAGGILYSFEADSGKTIWEQNFEVTEISSPAIYEKWIAVVATQGKIYVLDRQSGDVLFSWFVKGGGFSNPVISDNQLFLLSNASRLYSFKFKK